MASRKPTESMTSDETGIGDETVERRETERRIETGERTWSSAALGGLAGGLVFGVLLQATGTMPVVASLYGMESVAAGWVAHLFHGVVFALVFAAAVVRTDYRDARVGTTIALGAGYGVVLWLVAAGVVMPLWLDALGPNAPAIPNLDADGLAGHLLYGGVLGAVFAVARRR